MFVCAALACIAWGVDWSLSIAQPVDLNVGNQSHDFREYYATLGHVVDGDTIECAVLLGWNIVLQNERVRLLGIDAPEINTPEGKKAKEKLQELIAQHDKTKETGVQLVIAVEIGKERDHFGRTLARVYGRDAFDVCGAMLRDKFAVPYDGKRSTKTNDE